MGGWRRHGLLLLLALMYADNYVGRQIIAVMIEPIKAEYGVSDTLMGLISGLAFALTYALLGLPIARLGSRLSRTRLLAMSCLLWSLATISCGLTTGFFLLVAARMAVALAEAPSTPTALSIIADIYPPQQRSFAISCFTAAPTFAAIAALSLGAWFVAQHGWRATFFGIGLLMLPVSLVLACLRDPKPGHPLPEGASNGRMIDDVRALWQDVPIRSLIMATALASLGGTSMGMWNATFLVRTHGMALEHAGLIAGAVGGTCAGFGILFSGWFTDRMARRNPHSYWRIPLFGHVVAVLTLIGYLSWPVGHDLPIDVGFRVPGAIIFTALSGFFSVWWAAASFSLLTHLVRPEQRSTALTLQSMTTTIIGIGIGPVLVGLLSDLLTPRLGSESLRYALFANVLVLGSAIVALKRTSSHPFFKTREPETGLGQP